MDMQFYQLKPHLVIPAGILALTLLLGNPGSAPALQVHIEGDRISMTANGEPLTEVLEAFVHAGVTVKFDPGIDATVSGVLEEEDLQKALNRLLGSFSNVMIWEMIRGPLGPLPKLDELHVFRPGQQRRIIPFKPKSNNLNVMRGKNGAEFVQDEMLIGVQGDMSANEFRRLLNQIGGSLLESLPDQGIYRIKLPPNSNVLDLVNQIKGDTRIAVAEPNYTVSLPTPGSTGGGTSAPQDASDLLNRSTPGEHPIAILDSGLASQYMAKDLIAGSLDATNPERAVKDIAGHGTQMALIASGSVVPKGTAITDVEANTILGIKAFDENGKADNFSLMRSINYAIEKGSRVMSMSWGSDTHSTFMEDAMQDAATRGLVTIASAGNEPHGNPVYPAAYDSVIAVGALDENGVLWEKSNYGDWIDLAAPGKADFPIGHNGPPGAYAGTSIATPFVAQQINTYLKEHPEATADQAVEHLKQSLSDAGSPGKDKKYGYGVLDNTAVQRFLR